MNNDLQDLEIKNDDIHPPVSMMPFKVKKTSIVLSSGKDTESEHVGVDDQNSEQGETFDVVAEHIPITRLRPKSSTVPRGGATVKDVAFSEFEGE